VKPWLEGRIKLPVWSVKIWPVLSMTAAKQWSIGRPGGVEGEKNHHCRHDCRGEDDRSSEGRRQGCVFGFGGLNVFPGLIKMPFGGGNGIGWVF
jgi:hypothetical protein